MVLWFCGSSVCKKWKEGGGWGETALYHALASACSLWYRLSSYNTPVFPGRWMAKQDQRGQMVCPRSHSKGKLSVKSMLWFLPWQKPHVSPLKDRARQSLPLSAWEGLEERGNQSLEILTEGMNNTVAAFSSLSWGSSPDRASTSAGEPKGSGWIYLSSILKLAGAPTCYGPALLPAPRS